jgi:hypothetical protein
MSRVPWIFELNELKRARMSMLTSDTGLYSESSPASR